MKTDFINEAKPREKQQWDSNGSYGFDHPSIYLFTWNRLFQIIISQAGTYFLTGKYNEGMTGIFKCEGGCSIPGVGDLCLCENFCYFDISRRDKEIKDMDVKMAELITHVVFKWIPTDPIISMLSAAAEFIKVPVEEFTKAVEKSQNVPGLNGDMLSSFFNWNPFSKTPIDRDYQQFCLITINKESEAEVQQRFDDEDLGERLLKKINDKIRKIPEQSYRSAMTCRPKRFEKDGLHFWINTGRMTQIDGWKTQKQIEEFLNSDGKLIDKATY